MTVVQAYICAKHYQVPFFFRSFMNLGEDRNDHWRGIKTVVKFDLVAAWESGPAQDPRLGRQREGARHPGHLRQLLLLLRRPGRHRTTGRL